mmetsp:Transcript_39101/g.78954  ORF Transcript_39101/g.78954 Transcript_39101/m.78954 type:complete len:217 (+) Transcript_39101:14-664(+)
MLRSTATYGSRLTTKQAVGRIRTFSSSEFKIYTRTGDKGTSQLFTGERRPKTDPTFDALGSTDELNSHIGVARELALLDGNLVDVAEQLEEIMSRMFDVGAAIATPLDSASASKASRAHFDHSSHTDQLEKWIDLHSSTLPPLKNFVLPSGGMTAAQLHVCRSVCRRAERATHPLVERKSLDPEVATYMNRLSDYLFTIARIAAQRGSKPEVIWKK